MTKICTKCKHILDIKSFNVRSSSIDGLSAWCRMCLKEYATIYRQTHKESAKQWRTNNKVKMAEYNKEYSRNNRTVINKRHSEWMKQNKDKLNLKRRIRMASNPQSKIAQLLRTRLRSALRAQNATKNSSAVDNLGCSIEEFKKYLENLFVDGMSWDNHGEWHIDHIKPLDSFNLVNSLEQKLACHYTNLQPLWAIDNLKKWTK